MAHKVFCTFVKHPTSDLERAIAGALFKFLAAHNRKDIEGVIDCFTQEAQIDSLGGRGIVHREYYRNVLETYYPSAKDTYMDCVTISVRSRRLADVLGILGVTLLDGRYVGNIYRMRFVAIGKRWLIAETKFLTRERFSRSRYAEQGPVHNGS